MASHGTSHGTSPPSWPTGCATSSIPRCRHIPFVSVDPRQEDSFPGPRVGVHPRRTGKDFKRLETPAGVMSTDNVPAITRSDGAVPCGFACASTVRARAVTCSMLVMAAMFWIRNSNYRIEFQRAVIEAGFADESWTIHTLRHFFASSVIGGRCPCWRSPDGWGTPRFRSSLASTVTRLRTRVRK